MPSFMHLFPSMTPDLFWGLKRREYNALKAYRNALTKAGNGPKS